MLIVHPYNTTLYRVYEKRLVFEIQISYNYKVILYRLLKTVGVKNTWRRKRVLFTQEEKSFAKLSSTLRPLS